MITQQKNENEKQKIIISDNTDYKRSAKTDNVMQNLYLMFYYKISEKENKLTVFNY